MRAPLVSVLMVSALASCAPPAPARPPQIRHFGNLPVGYEAVMRGWGPEESMRFEIVERDEDDGVVGHVFAGESEDVAPIRGDRFDREGRLVRRRIPTGLVHIWTPHDCWLVEGECAIVAHAELPRVPRIPKMGRRRVTTFGTWHGAEFRQTHETCEPDCEPRGEARMGFGRDGLPAYSDRPDIPGVTLNEHRLP